MSSSWISVFLAPPADDPEVAGAFALIAALVTEREARGYTYASINQEPHYLAIKGLPPEVRCRIIQGLIERRRAHQRQGSSTHWTIQALIEQLLRSNLPFTAAQLSALLPDGERSTSREDWLTLALIRQYEALAKKAPLDESTRARLTELLTSKHMRLSWNGSDHGKAKLRLNKLLNLDSPDETLSIQGIDPFGERIGAFVRASDQLDAWTALLNALGAASGSKPSAKFLDATDRLIAPIGGAVFCQQVEAWLAGLTRAAALAYAEHEAGGNGYSFLQHHLLMPVNQPFAKGLIWALTRHASPGTLSALANFAVRCYERVPGTGPIEAGLGNAAIGVLSDHGLAGVSHLSRIQLRIPQPSVKQRIQGAIAAAAARLGLTADAIEDLAIPEYGLTLGGKTLEFDGFRAEVTVERSEARVEWRKADGGQLKSPPAAVKTQHAAALKALGLELKELKKTLSAQRDRLDRSHIHDRSWRYAEFAERYLNHGLMAVVARQLIWRIGDGALAALWLDGRWVEAAERPLAPPAPDATVRLWHPLDSATAEVLDWRALLIKHQIQQPLKQAFREIYVLTEAELRTRTYSNRMAAHILRQHQMSTLASSRGWRYSLMGAYDDGRDGEVATLELPAHNLQAQLWILELSNADGYNATGIWNYVATDQVRFTQAGEVVPLAAIPPVIFSEVMRDADLLVGVASIGNDPAWQDSGANPDRRRYWQSYAFGELSEAARSRQALLESVLPRLKIARVSTIQGHFLVVRGKLRTYKIHIGSTNILMEPNDQYLCIVPSSARSGDTGNLFLPFEGDRGFSILLSKALLLANDDTITDPTITRQLSLP
jgi:hypothetical protein